MDQWHAPGRSPNDGPLRRQRMSHRELATAVDEAVDPTSLMQRVCDRTLELIAAADGVAIGLVSVTLLACYLGARKVTGIQPARLLNEE